MCACPAPEQRKEYLQGVLSKINVALDPRTQEHLLTLEFLFPIVGDHYKNATVIEGEKVLYIKGSFAKDKMTAKKKAVNSVSKRG